MTEDKIRKIREHIEIHARREPASVKITQILWEAVEELEQFEKLKCCGNCKYHSFWGDELKCNYGLKEALQEDRLVECHNLDKWGFCK